jgi:LPS sulfotransferase NodH
LLSRWCGPAQRFVILTTGRTGSELLVSLLNSHPRIACGGELLKEGRAFPNRYVESRAAMAGLRGADAYGWKLLLNQFRAPAGTVPGIGDPDSYPARLHAMGYQAILLVRENPVHQALSAIRGSQTQFHHRRADTTEFAPLTADPVALMASTWILEGDSHALESSVATLPHLRLTYESDLLDPATHQTTVDRVCDYLGIQSAPVRTDLVKVAPPGLRQSISNFEEVAELFRGTRFGSYLDEGQ